MGYLYQTPAAPKGQYTVVNLFQDGRWRLLALGHLYWRACLWFLRAWYIYLIVLKFSIHAFWRVLQGDNQWQWPRLRDVLLSPTRRICVSSGNYPVLNYLWWTYYFQLYDLNMFEEDYKQAWHDRLKRQGPVVWIKIFLGSDSLSVPILRDKEDTMMVIDRKTFKTLRMWHSWLRVRRGLEEILLPKRLVRIDRVKICKAVKDTTGLGSPIESLNLGRSDFSHVFNFENPSRIPGDQRFQTEAIAAKPEEEGIEFVRAWDAVSISVISMVPFVISLAFAGAWTGISIGKYEADAQVATQTAFTVASYIVTAGALLIALFSWIVKRSTSDLQSNITPRLAPGAGTHTLMIVEE